MLMRSLQSTRGRPRFCEDSEDLIKSSWQPVHSSESQAQIPAQELKMQDTLLLFSICVVALAAMSLCQAALPQASALLLVNVTFSSQLILCLVLGLILG